MCGRKKRDPRIEEEQRLAREAAEAAKAEALAKQEAQRQKQLEAEKEAAATKAATEASNAAKAKRQQELAQQAATEQDKMNKRMAELERANRSLIAGMEGRSADTVREKSPEGIMRSGVEVTSTGLKGPSDAAKRRGRFGRSGRRGRRSLLTSMGGGIGYFSRFL